MPAKEMEHQIKVGLSTGEATITYKYEEGAEPVESVTFELPGSDPVVLSYMDAFRLHKANTGIIVGRDRILS